MASTYTTVNVQPNSNGRRAGMNHLAHLRVGPFVIARREWFRVTACARPSRGAGLRLPLPLALSLAIGIGAVLAISQLI